MPNSVDDIIVELIKDMKKSFFDFKEYCLSAYQKEKLTSIFILKILSFYKNVVLI